MFFALNIWIKQKQTLKAIKKEEMEFVKVDDDDVNVYFMTFTELNDISIKNKVSFA